MFSPRSLLFSGLMATMMSVLIGGAITLIRNGTDGFWPAFWSTAPIAFAVALPTSLFVTPLVSRLVDLLLGTPSEVKGGP